MRTRITLVVASALLALASSLSLAATWNTLNISKESTYRYQRWTLYDNVETKSYDYWGSANWGIHLTLSDNGYWSDATQLRVQTTTGVGGFYAVVYSPYLSAWGRVTSDLSILSPAPDVVPVRAVIDIFYMETDSIMNYYGGSWSIGEGLAVIKDMTTEETLMSLPVTGTGPLSTIVYVPRTHTVGLELQSISDLTDGAASQAMGLNLVGRLEWSSDLTTQSSLTGTAGLGDFAGDLSTQTVTVEIRQNGSAVKTQAVALDGSGSFALSDVTPGEYDVWIKGSHWLGVLTPAVTIDGQTSMSSVLLVNGDANGDNAVGLLDMGTLKSAWGTNPPSNENADLNGDGSVGLLDLGILKKNWGKSGDA